MFKKRRKSSYRYHGDPEKWNKVLKILGVLAVIAAILGGAWAITLSQPRKVGWKDMDTPVKNIPPNVAAMHDKSLALEHDFHEAEKMRDITSADIENLREALRLEVAYIEQTHISQQGSDRLTALTETLETYEAKPLYEQSSTDEAEAAKLENAGDLEGARKLYGEAEELENRILNEFSHSKYSRAPGRLTVLQIKLQYLTSRPIYEESTAAEAKANAAVLKQDWATALTNFQHALELQQRINREFPEQSFASSGRLKSLSDQVTALQSLPQHQKIMQLVADAHAAEAAGNFDKAAALYQDAERQQGQLSANFPQSRFAADTAFATSLEDMRQTALSRPLANEILAQAATLLDDLRHRRTDHAADAIAVIQQKAARFHDTFPHSKLIDDRLLERLEYLYYKRADLAAIQEQVYSLLQPLPGQTRYLMDKQEVTQALYQAVAGGNPSRNAGPTLPVDSVNWNEAEKFCQRLGWILERPVRLPTQDDFRLALGVTDKVDLGAASWNADNAGGKTQAVATKAANANGFHDLLGNVAEWLERPGDYDDDMAPAAGGNVQSAAEGLRTAAPAELAISSRNAFTGFRFVVDTDDAAPLLPATTGANNQAGSPSAK